MACVKPDGGLTSAAAAVLAGVAAGLAEDELAGRLGRPIYQIRAITRELVGHGLVTMTAAGAVPTEAGRTRNAVSG